MTDRANANLTIIGKSGNGKTFFLKKLIMQHAQHLHKIYILDPENEYKPFVEYLGGIAIDTSGTADGRINPFQVYVSLETDNLTTKLDYLQTHKQFLEQFLATLLELDRNEMNLLNLAINEMYSDFKIYPETDISKLKPADFPIFTNLISIVNKKIREELDQDFKTIYKRLYLSLLKCGPGGLYSNMWNGPSTLEIKDDIIVFNFKELTETSNQRIVNCQMSLVMNFLQQQINKNRYMNLKNGQENKVLLIVDEAHKFVHNDMQISLNFLVQMSKRIRKYNGSLIVATQNVKDFTGGDKASTQSEQILGNSQYSIILGFNPSDINALKSLYANTKGGLNDIELEILSKAPRGNGLLFVSNNKKLDIKIDLYENELHIIDMKGV